MKKNILFLLVCICTLSACGHEKPLVSIPTNIPAVTGEDFSIIILPDTQLEVQDFPKVFMSQIDWIVANTKKLNIKAIVHVGDQVNVAEDEKQWKTYNEGTKKLDAQNMPVLLSLGNHDHPGTLYDKYFPISRYNQQPWWGGQMGKDTENKYILLTIAGKDYIFISLDFCPTKEEIKWGNEILDKYPDREALLATHAYLDKDAERHPHICTDTNYIWNDFIKLHKNLQLVVSGHVHAENMRTDKDLAGNIVYQMLADFQDDDNGGNGWLRILHFSPQDNQINVMTYSPFLRQSQDDKDSKFQFPYKLK